ncbi:MAG: hypothetical protein Q7J69_07150 [Candidatus Omnitrophota bacterium]|nr:hypothetical protein [Candidatus Omnitrophota bacterium]
MSSSFGLLKILSVTFKVLACVVLVLMLTGAVGIVMTPADPSSPVPVPLILNMVFNGILAFLTMVAFGEVIRLLLAIESQTRKE